MCPEGNVSHCGRERRKEHIVNQETCVLLVLALVLILVTWHISSFTVYKIEITNDVLYLETFQNWKYQIDMKYYHWVTHSLNWKELQMQKPCLLSFSSCTQLQGLTWFMADNWHLGCVYGINKQSSTATKNHKDDFR